MELKEILFKDLEKCSHHQINAAVCIIMIVLADLAALPLTRFSIFAFLMSFAGLYYICMWKKQEKTMHLVMKANIFSGEFKRNDLWKAWGGEGTDWISIIMYLAAGVFSFWLMML